MIAAAAILLFLLAGSLVYCVLTIVAARKYLAVSPPKPGQPVPISVLKPLHGVDEGLEESLRSFFQQDYADYELLFAVHQADDSAVAVLERVRAGFSEKPASRLIVTGEPPGP